MPLSYEKLTVFTGPDEQLNRLIDWKAGSVDVMRHYKSAHAINWREEHRHMQRQFTIELRVDFEDSGKLQPLKEVLQQAARHAYATAQLISDNPKSTQIAIFSDDFFSGHEEIKLLEDTIQQGLDQIGESSGADSVSSELAASVNG